MSGGTGADLVPCPICMEPIRRGAKKCRFCGEWLSEPSPASPPDPDAELEIEEEPARPEPRSEPVEVHATAQPFSLQSPTAHQKTNALAIASLLCALLGALIGAIPAVIFGFNARRQIRESKGAERGDGLAIAGIVVGGIQIFFLVVVGMLLIKAAQPTPKEKADKVAEDARQAWVDAEFQYKAAHGTFTTTESILIQMGAFVPTNFATSPNWIRPYSADANGFCIDAQLQGFQYSLYHLASDPEFQYWTQPNLHCKDRPWQYH